MNDRFRCDFVIIDDIVRLIVGVLALVIGFGCGNLVMGYIFDSFLVYKTGGTPLTNSGDVTFLRYYLSEIFQGCTIAEAEEDLRYAFYGCIVSLTLLFIMLFVENRFGRQIKS